MNKAIFVTKPSLAPLPEFVSYLERIWETGVMTHNGPFMQQLERELMTYLEVPDAICLANGTCAMQLAIRALDLKGEIITTPFTFIATANIIAWERCHPVFVDIDPSNWNIDPNLIESAITPQTVAILPVHVFSAPCAVQQIQDIADRHNLKVIYDAAHAMAVNCGGQSILNYGDISCVSFHATKLFNTCEGGACVTKDQDMAARIRRLRFFGFNEQKDIMDSGMNAKMTEINAALGLVNLKYIDSIRANRKVKYEQYLQRLRGLPGLTFQKFNPDEYNYSYMPIRFDKEENLLLCIKRLEDEHIFPRRYFYPSLEQLQIFSPQSSLPVSDDVARTILCLPLYDTLTIEEVDRICSLVCSGR
jgi:dTDP-4-amino-4,6-dideoxygalactose transaminase